MLRNRQQKTGTPVLRAALLPELVAAAQVPSQSNGDRNPGRRGCRRSHGPITCAPLVWSSLNADTVIRPAFCACGRALRPYTRVCPRPLLEV